MDEKQVSTDLADVSSDSSRRTFLKQVSAAGVGAVTLRMLDGEVVRAADLPPDLIGENAAADALLISLNVDGNANSMHIDTLVTLLDALREWRDLTGHRT